MRMTESLKTKTIKSISFSLVAQIVGYGFQLISNIILSQILFPSDYGINGFAMIFIGFFTLFNDLGINTAVIRREHLTDNELFTAFTIKTILSLAICIVLITGAPFVRHFFDDPNIVNVIRVLTLSLFVNCFAFIPGVLLKRELSFKLTAYVEMASSIIMAGVCILLAVLGFRYWSLVLGLLASRVFTLVALNFVRPRRIKFIIDIKAARQFISFGMNLFYTGIIAFAILNFDNLLVGSVLGATALGFYGLAYNWGSLVFNTVNNVIISVLVPAFAKIQSDREKIKIVFLQTLEYIALIAVLTNLILFLCAHEFLFYVLGKGTEKWLPALPTLQVFCLYGIFRTLNMTVAPVFLALGYTKIFLIADSINAVAQYVLIYPVLKNFGIEGLAVLVTVVFGLKNLIYYPDLKQEIGLNLGEVFRSLAPVVIAGVLTLVCGLLLWNYLPSSLGWMFGKALIATFTMIVAYGSCSSWKVIREIKSMFPFFGSRP